MSILASVVEIKNGYVDDVQQYLQGLDGVELYETATDSGKLVIVIDTHDDLTEELCKKIIAHEGVISLLHHSVYFDNE